VGLAAVTLATVLASRGAVAVLGLSSAEVTGEHEAPPTGPLAAALAAAGLQVISGHALRERLTGDGRPMSTGVLSSVEKGVLAAEEDYDRGEFRGAAQLAASSHEALLQAGPSPRRELLARELQILWGAALLQQRSTAAAASHFREALQRNPQTLIDRDRFAPPVQRLFEEARDRLLAGPQATLDVSGTPGATLFVDGVPRGTLPLRVALPPHRCTLWVEVSGQPGLAHEFSVFRPTALSVDWQLEVATAFTADGDPIVEVPRFAVRAQTLLEHLIGKAGASALVALEWAGPERRQQRLVRYGPDGIEKSRLLLPAEAVDWTRVVPSLLEESAPAPALPASQLAVESTAAARAEPHRFPWLLTGLVAGGVAVVAVAVAIGFSIHPTNAEIFGPATPRP